MAIPPFALSVSNLSFGYSSHVKKIVENVSHTFESGSIYAIVGPSGAGKSTFLRLLSGLLLASEGDISLSFSEEVKDTFKEEGGWCSFVPAGEVLLPWRTVRGNLALPLELGGGKIEKSVKDEIIDNTLGRFNLQEYQDHFPDELSSGLKKLVALARIYIENRPVVLLDEPFSSIDFFSRGPLYTIIRSMAKNEGKLVILITHDFIDCERLHTDSIIVLKDGGITSNVDVRQLFQLRDGVGRNSDNATFEGLIRKKEVLEQEGKKI